MVRAYAKSDIGKARDTNQDSFYITDDQFSNIQLYIWITTDRGRGEQRCNLN